MKWRNKDLIDFVESILSRYNATPDEWDAFESVKWGMDTTSKKRCETLSANWKRP